MSSAEQPSGFYGAPVSKALAMLSVGCSVGLVALDAKPQALLTFTQLERLQWWRLLTVNVAFAGNAEIIFASVLAAGMRPGWRYRSMVPVGKNGSCKVHGSNI